jgi:diadenylate cyclase
VNLFAEPLPELRWQDGLDILIMAVVFYNLILLLRGTRAIQMLFGLGLLLAVSFAAGRIGLHAVNWVLQNFLGAVVLVIIILFQPELRRALANGGGAAAAPSIKEERVLQECVRGTQALAAKRIGADRAAARNRPEPTSTAALARRPRLAGSLLFLPASRSRRRGADPGQSALPGRVLPAPVAETELLKDLGTPPGGDRSLRDRRRRDVVSEESGAVSLAVGDAATRRGAAAAGIGGLQRPAVDAA